MCRKAEDVFERRFFSAGSVPKTIQAKKNVQEKKAMERKVSDTLFRPNSLRDCS